MKKSKNNFIKLSVLVAIVLVGVAYAAITTNLTVSGSTSVKGNSSNFSNNVIFASATASSGSTASIDTTDKHIITFTTAELKAVNDEATLTYTIKNESNYGASISAVTCSSNDTSFSTYVTATPSRSTTLTLAKGATSSAETVKIKMIKTYAQTTVKSMTFTCTMTATATGA